MLPHSYTTSETHMTEREQRSSNRPKDKRVEETVPAVRADDVAHKIDDLLDEIDTVLEENAEEFVKNYVQKGGE